MTLAVFFVILSALALVGLVFLARGHWFSRSVAVAHPSQLQPIDVDAFRNLMDESEEEYLREKLPSREFRRVYRERMLAAVDYVRGAYCNAGILVQIAQAARESTDPAISEAAGNLFENAVQLRWYAFQVIPRLEEINTLDVQVGVEEGRAGEPSGRIARPAVICGQRGQQPSIELLQVVRQVVSPVADAYVGQVKIIRAERGLAQLLRDTLSR